MNGKGWHELPDVTGKAPEHSRVARATQLKDTLRTPMVLDARISLLDEAKKYNSAEEFIQAQRVLYHGTPEIFDTFKEQTTFFTEDKRFAELVASEQTDNVINKFETETRPDGSTYYPGVMERYGILNLFDSNNPSHVNLLYKALPDKLKETSFIGGMYFATKHDILNTIISGGKNTWTAYEGGVKDIIKQLGFDGWKMTEKGKETIGVFEPNKLLTKTQLIDIWHKTTRK